MRAVGRIARRWMRCAIVLGPALVGPLLIGPLLVLICSRLVWVRSLLILVCPLRIPIFPRIWLTGSLPRGLALREARSWRRRGRGTLSRSAKRGQTEKQNRGGNRRWTHSFRVSNLLHRSLSRQAAEISIRINLRFRCPRSGLPSDQALAHWFRGFAGRAPPRPGPIVAGLAASSL